LIFALSPCCRPSQPSRINEKKGSPTCARRAARFSALGGKRCRSAASLRGGGSGGGSGGGGGGGGGARATTSQAPRAHLDELGRQ